MLLGSRQGPNPKPLHATANPRPEGVPTAAFSRRNLEGREGGMMQGSLLMDLRFRTKSWSYIAF